MPATILTVPPFSTLCNAAFALRREVFVWEQKVPEAEEHDADDMTATHFVAILEGEVVGTLRLIDKPEHIKIGRVAVRQAFRGQGIARQMMLAAMDHARAMGRDLLSHRADRQAGLLRAARLHRLRPRIRRCRHAPPRHADLCLVNGPPR